MEVIFSPCAGLDVPKKSVRACRIIPEPTGRQADGGMALKGFETMTADLLAWCDWLAEAGNTQVAMETAGEYWKTHEGFPLTDAA